MNAWKSSIKLLISDTLLSDTSIQSL